MRVSAELILRDYNVAQNSDGGQEAESEKVHYVFQESPTDLEPTWGSEGPW